MSFPQTRGERLFYVLTWPVIFPLAAVGYLLMWIWYGPEELKKPTPEREYNRRRMGDGQ